MNSYRNKKAISACIAEYLPLLNRIDSWFRKCLAISPDDIQCSKGCSDCCRGLFDITLPDALLLREGFLSLPHQKRLSIVNSSESIAVTLQKKWGDLAAPFILNYRPENEWDMLMPDDDETPCVFLDRKGNCSVYSHRPMTCRLHGIPLIDESGEVMHDEWCSKNFCGSSPLGELSLAAPFYEYFRKEVKIMKELTQALFGNELRELDTFIPFAAIVDYESFDWKKWFAETELVINPPPA